MYNIIKTYWIPALGLIAGAIGGFLYWKYVGCANGQCPITSSHTYSAIYGGILGVLITNLFTPNKKKES